uniref:Uncharacterized protein n=1 Tax=Arundo donax TaxID=35708 RepID=A0A0A9EMW2_ARUDO
MRRRPRSRSHVRNLASFSSAPFFFLRNF